MNLSPYNEYLLVMPNGDAKGFNDFNLMKAYVNRYYEEEIKIYSHKHDYGDLTDMLWQERNNICERVGVNEGVCVVYDTNNFIENLRENLVFEEEKEEVISKLLKKDINLNIYEYSIDNILAETKVIQMIEPYGEM